MKNNYVAKHMRKAGSGQHEDKVGKRSPRQKQKKEWKKETKGFMGKSLNEKTLTSNFSLSVAQKSVLTRTANAPTPKVAGDEVSENPKFVTARDMLAQYELLDYDKTNGTATVTDKGIQTMKDENLIDELGELTEEGKKFAFPPEENPPKEQSFESLSIFKQTVILAEKSDKE